MLTKFLDPKNDFAFRKIFGTEKNKDILIHFLNDVLEFETGNPIKDLTFLKTVQEPEVKAQKTSLVDVMCEDEKGNHYIVEMQVAKERGFEKRAQYYAAKAYCSQMTEGGKYHNLKAVIFLAITDFIMFPHKTKPITNHITLDKFTHEHDLKDFTYTFIELPRFTKTIDQLSNTQELWMYFLKHATETTPQDFEKLEHEKMITKAYQQLERFSWTEEEMRTYDQLEKYEWAHIAQMDQKYDEGLAQGKVEGLAEGIEKGEAQGLVKGVEKGVEKGKIEVAKELMSMGISLEQIQRATGLSLQYLVSCELKDSIKSS